MGVHVGGCGERRIRLAADGFSRTLYAEAAHGVIVENQGEPPISTPPISRDPRRSSHRLLPFLFLSRPSFPTSFVSPHHPSNFLIYLPPILPCSTSCSGHALVSFRIVALHHPTCRAVSADPEIVFRNALPRVECTTGGASCSQARTPPPASALFALQ